MIFKNIKIAFRFLSKHKEYTAVNIFGLTVSLAAVLFIGLYIYDELSFDRFHTNADRIYRVIESETSPEGVSTELADVPFSIPELNDQCPSIENDVRLTLIGRSNISNDENENKIYESFRISEQAFLDMFDFKVLHGAKENALKESHTVVLTETTAERL